MSFCRFRRLPGGRRSCTSRRRRFRRFRPGAPQPTPSTPVEVYEGEHDVRSAPALGSVPMSTNALPTQSSDFPAWYGEVVRRAGLAENSPVRGAMVIKPYGYAIWETIQRELDDRIKATGHENFYFPVLMPAGCSRTVTCRCSTTSGPTQSVGS